MGGDVESVGQGIEIHMFGEELVEIPHLLPLVETRSSQERAGDADGLKSVVARENDRDIAIFGASDDERTWAKTSRQDQATR